MLRELLFARGAAVLLAVSIAATALAQQERFDGHKVVRATVSSQKQLDVLLSLTDDVWSEAIGVGPLDVRVTPAQFEQLQASGIPFDVLIEDVQALLEANQRDGGIAGDPWTAYMNLDEVYAYVDSLVALRPDLASKIVVGQSLLGRDIICLKITGAGAGPKPGVCFQACQHAREWITIPTGLYFADTLIRNYDLDPAIRELVDRAEIYLIVCVNPDGYAYTWSNNRLWRKNRRDNPGSCDGVDLNRNWSVGYATGGSSSNPCDETYHGTGEFSEPETTVVRDFLLARPNIVAFTDIHNYGQYILLPYGWTPQFPANYDEYLALGTEMVAIIDSVHGTNYTTGACYHTLYQASGCASDWGHENVGLGITIELRDTGTFGFQLPPSQILPNCEEQFPALFHLTDYATVVLRIGFPQGLPRYVAPDGTTTLPIEITENFGTVDPGGVQLLVRASGQPDFTAYPAMHVSGTLFEATFPALPCDTSAEYYVVAATLEGPVVQSPADAPLSFYSAPVGSVSVQFADDFETDLGWVAENLGASSGDWQRGVPVNDPGWDYDPASDSDGSGRCYLTQNQAGNTDVDGGAVRLTSPTFDMSQGGAISYDYYLYLTDSNGADRLLVEASDNGSAGPWREVLRHTTHGGLEWRSQEITADDLQAAGLSLTANMKIRFTANDGDPQSIVEAGIDAFLVYSVSCAEYPLGDMNCDGSLDGGDIDPFFLALGFPDDYQSQYPGCNLLNGDINDDGDLNGADIDPFFDLLGG